MSGNPIPAQYKVENSTAVFTTLAQPDNLYHFWHDMFKYVYATVQLIGKLNSRIRLLYWLPLGKKIPKIHCCDMRRYQILMKGMKFESSISYLSVPSGTCFQMAVFGQVDPTSQEGISAASNVRNGLGINRSRCPLNQVLIIKRGNRRILNIEELKTSAEQLGYNNTKIIRFETLPVVKQLYEVSCARVLIGVQGQGLAWSIFMPPGALVIEISWPDKYWPRFYNRYVEDYGQQYRAIEVKAAGVMMDRMKEQKMLKIKGYKMSLIGRLANVKININEFAAILKNYTRNY